MTTRKRDNSQKKMGSNVPRESVWDTTSLQRYYIDFSGQRMTATVREFTLDSFEAVYIPRGAGHALRDSGSTKTWLDFGYAGVPLPFPRKGYAPVLGAGTYAFAMHVDAVRSVDADGQQEPWEYVDNNGSGGSGGMALRLTEDEGDFQRSFAVSVMVDTQLVETKRTPYVAVYSDVFVSTDENRTQDHLDLPATWPDAKEKEALLDDPRGEHYMFASPFASAGSFGSFLLRRPLLVSADNSAKSTKLARERLLMAFKLAHGMLGLKSIGVVHRDLSDNNVLVSHDNSSSSLLTIRRPQAFVVRTTTTGSTVFRWTDVGYSPVIADFGFAWQVKRGPYTGNSYHFLVELLRRHTDYADRISGESLFGTPGSTAPEVFLLRSTRVYTSAVKQRVRTTGELRLLFAADAYATSQLIVNAMAMRLVRPGISDSLLERAASVASDLPPRDHHGQPGHTTTASGSKRDLTKVLRTFVALVQKAMKQAGIPTNLPPNVRNEPEELAWHAAIYGLPSDEDLLFFDEPGLISETALRPLLQPRLVPDANTITWALQMHRVLPLGNFRNTTAKFHDTASSLIVNLKSTFDAMHARLPSADSSNGINVVGQPTLIANALQLKSTIEKFFQLLNEGQATLDAEVAGLIDVLDVELQRIDPSFTQTLDAYVRMLLGLGVVPAEEQQRLTAQGVVPDMMARDFQKLVIQHLQTLRDVHGFVQSSTNNTSSGGDGLANLTRYVQHFSSVVSALRVSVYGPTATSASDEVGPVDFGHISIRDYEQAIRYARTVVVDGAVQRGVLVQQVRQFKTQFKLNVGVELQHGLAFELLGRLRGSDQRLLYTDDQLTFLRAMFRWHPQKRPTLEELVVESNLFDALRGAQQPGDEVWTMDFTPHRSPSGTTIVVEEGEEVIGADQSASMTCSYPACGRPAEFKLPTSKTLSGDGDVFCSKRCAALHWFVYNK
jgi:serine/threonine protein kinase